MAAVAVAVTLLAGAGSAGADHGIVIGLQCDRTGATRTAGAPWCAGYRDYARLVNTGGGPAGHPLDILEVDHGGETPRAVEGYQRQKRAGAVLIGLYGWSQTAALVPMLVADRIPATCPGFGPATAASGQRYPYLFPVSATTWSQMGAAVAYARDRLDGLKGKRFAYLFDDSRPGREPIPVIEALAALEGFEVRLYSVPHPGLEMDARIRDIVRRYRAGFIITHLFGRSPSVAIRGLERMGYSLTQVVSLAGGSAEAEDLQAAGGAAAAEGHSSLQLAGVGSDYAVLDEIRGMYRSQGREPPPEMTASVHYNRGVLVAALHVEAVRNALRARKDGRITGEDVRRGFEEIRAFALGGLAPPLEVTAGDHEGGGWVQVWQVRGGGLVKGTDWFRGYPEVVAGLVRDAAAREATSRPR